MPDTKVKRQVPVKRRGRLRLKFIGETVSELRKVTWPSRGEAGYLTTLVIIVCIAMAIILGLFDYGFAELMNALVFK
ncbi:preprotein translocase subunit SecE [Chloroflexota bacterium]